MPKKGEVKKLEGQTFGRLTVRELVGVIHRRAMWMCECCCGRNAVVSGGHLLSGHTTSCGCYSRDRSTVASFKHGFAIHHKVAPEYMIWTAMKARCRNPKNKQWKDYGGRGIKVCQRWRLSFESFIEDMGRRPSAELTIDRINNDGNYEPGNCRWATRTQQMNNTRRQGKANYANTL